MRGLGKIFKILGGEKKAPGSQKGNPYHRPAGPGGGRFASGPMARTPEQNRKKWDLGVGLYVLLGGGKRDLLYLRPN
jgi:hypothetical protein